MRKLSGLPLVFIWAAVLASSFKMAQAVTVTPPQPPPPLDAFGANAGGYLPNFVVACPISHRDALDPIVSFGVKPTAHLHDFFGNTSLNEFSTVASLQAATTTCHRSADRSGYWLPTLYQNGVEVTPIRLDVYYQSARSSVSNNLQTLPPGLKMIAGEAHSTTPQDTSIVGWACGPQGQRSADVPTGCYTGQNATKPKYSYYQFFFPNCWNGVNLDSADHQRHMAYGKDNVCPATHPILVPTVRFVLIYPFLGEGGPGVTFSSHGKYSAHADFMNGWDQSALKTLINRCILSGARCGVN
ncbi:MAG: DUF1996 domain-containing protein [Aphanothece sp. CMT-3BRIN-NPC111]|jgi:hypothetical protein|nr:DUF1996 domain-containing protein [Aphanothece sp. CMT-3BRIN-NPC111]